MRCGRDLSGRDMRRVFDHLMGWVTGMNSTTAPLPPEPAPVAVIATSPTWCHKGQPVVAGERYMVDPATAQGLVQRGKARFS